jgi:polyhydroxyalkanoate synthesis regulator phasin
VTTTDIRERLRNAIEADGPNRSFLEELKAHIEAKETRIAALEAKCALLSASLAQEEKRSTELEAQITSANDAWMELYGALTKRYEALEAQLAAIQNQEPVDWQTRYVGDPRQPGFWERTANPEYAKRIYTENADHTANGWEARPVYAHPLAAAASEYVLSLLVAAGHVSQEKVDVAREIACKTPGVAAAIAWESTTSVYTKFITDAKYHALTVEARKWYKPYRCSQCAVAASEDKRDAERWRYVKNHYLVLIEGDDADAFIDAAIASEKERQK